MARAFNPPAPTSTPRGGRGAGGVSIEFNGIPGFINRMEAGILRSVALAAEAGVKTAREQVAVDTSAAHSTIRAEIHGLTAEIVAGGDATTGHGENVDYAAHLEFGTRHTAAQPFMRPGAEEAMRVLRARALEAITTTVADLRDTDFAGETP